MQGNRQILAWALAAAASAALGVGPAAAEVVTLAPSKDNTIYQSSAAASNGSGPGIFVGATNSNSIRRGLVAFDVAAAVPRGAVVNSITLVFNAYKIGTASQGSLNLHRALRDWGEGASNAGDNGGSGRIAQAPDATWTMAMSSNQPWGTPGGDFAAGPSGGVLTGLASGDYTIASTAQLVADVQGWVNSPQTNFGWALRGDEAKQGSARGYRSSETASPPRIIIDFSVRTLSGDVDLDGKITARDYFAIDSGRALGRIGYTFGDFDHSGAIADAADYMLIDRAFLGQHQGPLLGAAAVPEAACLAMVSGMLVIARRRRSKC